MEEYWNAKDKNKWHLVGIYFNPMTGLHSLCDNAFHPNKIEVSLLHSFYEWINSGTKGETTSPTSSKHEC